MPAGTASAINPKPETQNPKPEDAGRDRICPIVTHPIFLYFPTPVSPAHSTYLNLQPTRLLPTQLPKDATQQAAKTLNPKPSHLMLMHAALVLDIFGCTEN